jgi:hypothetical protein
MSGSVVAVVLSSLPRKDIFLCLLHVLLQRYILIYSHSNKHPVDVSNLSLYALISVLSSSSWIDIFFVVVSSTVTSFFVLDLISLTFVSRLPLSFFFFRLRLRVLLLLYRSWFCLSCFGCAMSFVGVCLVDSSTQYFLYLQCATHADAAKAPHVTM